MRRRGVAVGLALLVCAGACSGDEPPAPQPSASSPAPTGEASTSATPTLTPPPLPPEATTPDAAGAAAFATHYFALVSYAYGSGDTMPMRQLSNPECGNCLQIADNIDRHYSSGGRYEGGDITVVSSQAQNPDATGLSLVTVVYDQAALQEFAADGSATGRGDGADHRAVEFYAEFVKGAWQVFGYALEEN